METSDQAAPFEENASSKPWAVWLAVFASLVLFSAVRSPAPGVNEPHYLAKAKHYWQPEWCAGDFFLESSDTHLVFYFTVGIFTKFLTLAQTAWLGRLAALALLAWGWLRLVSRLVPGAWTGLWAAWIYLAIAAVGNFSGEWMVGGVEGKVFAYGLGFWALADWLDGKWKRAALLAGLCVSFHPVVGGWIVICALAATVVLHLLSRKAGSATEGEFFQQPFREMAIAGGIFLLACLPGILPAIPLLTSGDPSQANEVAYIQVFNRIRHHLDPMAFSQGRYAAYALMIVLWLVVRTSLAKKRSEQWFAWFVGASIAIALVGIALGFGERPIETPEEITWRYRLLKFYPFRLADILVPMAVAVTIAGVIAEAKRSERINQRRIWLLLASVFVFSLLMPAVDRNPSRMSDEQLADWLATCRWIKEETPADAMFWTPSGSWAFKWYAQRAEYITRKDCPQDGDGIIEWNRRMQIQKENRLPVAFREERQLTYALFRKGRGKLPIEPVYENEHYRIYDLSVFSRE